MSELARVRSYHQLMAVLRFRAEEKQMTRELTDDTAGLQSGYAAKLMSPIPIKHLGPYSFGALLSALDLELVVVERAKP